MNKLGYLSAIILLTCGMAFAQSSAPSTDPSNSDKTSGQIQNGTSTPNTPGQAAGGPAKNPKTKTDASQDAVPDTTIDDQHNSTTSTTDVGAQNDRRSRSSNKMGTTGSTPGTADETPKGNKTATPPPSGSPTDQQPNSSTNPGTPPPHAMNMTPGARAVATHTPDPGTCMNSAALENAHVPSNSMLPHSNAKSSATCE
jgi:hypothetical protein